VGVGILLPHPLFTLKNLVIFQGTRNKMGTSPPYPLSLKGEGEYNRKRANALLNSCIGKGEHDEVGI